MILFILLLVGCFIMIAAATDIAGTTLCSDVTAQFVQQHPNGSCFDRSQIQKVLSVGFGYASGAVGAIAALLALVFTITGRRGRLVPSWPSPRSSWRGSASWSAALSSRIADPAVS